MRVEQVLIPNKHFHFRTDKLLQEILVLEKLCPGFEINQAMPIALPQTVHIMTVINAHHDRTLSGDGLL